MKVGFVDKVLENCAVDQGFAQRSMGVARAKVYARRIKSMLYAPNFENLKTVPGNFHELIGDRKGQWACNLDQPYRLISKGAEHNENVVWSNITKATVVEIVDYYK